MLRHAPLALATVALLAGCYRSHEPVPRDAGPPPTDAWRAPPPDAVTPDAFFPMSECARDRDCAGNLCVHDLSLLPRDLEAVSLHCAGPVGMLPPGLECDANAACDHGLCALAGGCVAPCLDASECRDDERCTRVPVVTGPSALQFARACVRWVDAPPGVTVAANDTLTVARFATESLSLEPMTAPTRLAMYVAAEVDDGRYVTSMTTSAGEVVFDAFQLGFEPQRLVVAPIGDIVPFLIPNGDADFPVGTAFVANLETSDTSELRRVVMDRATPGSTLELNVFYVGVEPPREGTPPREVEEMLRQLAVLLETVGLRLGRHRHFVVPGATSRTFEVIESDPEVQDLFTYSAGAARPALNVFLIRSGATFLGIAGGAPGAQNMHGLLSSGIAIAFEDLQSFIEMGGAPFDMQGTVIGHEIGHFLGFFHTTEIDGTVVEPLGDTPECPLTQDMDGDGVLAPFECEGLGANNVMFWGPFVPDARYSTRQGRILQNAMVLQ